MAKKGLSAAKPKLQESIMSAFQDILPVILEDYDKKLEEARKKYQTTPKQSTDAKDLEDNIKAAQEQDDNDYNLEKNTIKTQTITELSQDISESLADAIEKFVKELQVSIPNIPVAPITWNLTSPVGPVTGTGSIPFEMINVE